MIKSDFDFRNVNRSFSKIAQLDVNCAILETQKSSIESQQELNVDLKRVRLLRV